MSDFSTIGNPNKLYQFIIRSHDPDNDAIDIFVDWGDYTNTGWIGPYQLDEPIELKHSWTMKGTYTIKAMARDSSAAESDWGYFSKCIPYTHNIVWQFLQHHFPQIYTILYRILF